MSRDHTPSPWFVSADGYTIRVKPDCAFDIAAVVDDGHIDTDEATANAHRIAAAVNATADFTLDGLEQIVAQGKTLELALAATMIVRAEENLERAERHDAELTERVRAVTPVDAVPGLLANPLVPGAK